MRVSRDFLKDFAYCANFYGWNDADIEEVKQAVRENTGYRDYLTQLANAHRAGYRQTPENNYMRLDQWR